ncbi:MAG: tetratricopeptide repeat protein [Bacteroidota bacterium]
MDEARTLNVLAEEYVRVDVAKAKTCLHQSMLLAKSLQNDRSMSNSFSQMVTLFHNQGNIDSTLFYLNSLEKLAATTSGPDTDVVKANYNSTAGLYYKKSGNLKKALPFYKQAIAIAEKLGNKLSTAGQLFNLGNTYMNLGDYKNALQNHLKALNLFEESGNQKGVSFCYQSLSNSFIELKQFDQALKYANKSIALKRSLDDKRGLGTSEISLGQIYFGLENYEKALFHYNAALLIAREFKLVPEQTKIFFNIAKVYAAKKELKTATEYFKQTKLLAKQIADSSTMASVDMQLVSMQSKEQKLEQSEKKLSGGLAVFESTGNINKQVTGYQNMAAFYKANDEFEKALHYTNKYHELNDSIQGNELKVQLKKMEEQFNSAKKEKEIAILKKDQQLNEEQLKQQQLYSIGAICLALFALACIWMIISRNRLRQKMKELQLRNQIAADLHDEVGSSLSSIHLLSKMAAKKQINGKMETEIMEKVSRYTNETMDKMGDIVWMIKPNGKDGQGLQERMQKFLNEICFTQNIVATLTANGLDNARLSMEQRKGIYLVFKEAVNNAVKYSGAKNIAIKLSEHGKRVMMTIADDGTGFNAGEIAKGNGLDNMRIRAEELGGRLTIASQQNNGTSITMNIPA